jgi:hypothetical protein
MAFARIAVFPGAFALAPPARDDVTSLACGQAAVGDMWGAAKAERPIVSAGWERGGLRVRISTGVQGNEGGF